MDFMQEEELGVEMPAIHLMGLVSKVKGLGAEWMRYSLEGLVLEVEGLGAERMRYLLDGFSVGGGRSGSAEKTYAQSGALRIGKGRDLKREKSAFGLSFASRGIR